MRPIKYRAYHPRFKKLERVISFDIDNTGRVVAYNTPEASYPWVKKEDVVIFIQSTGLLDKNGKEIYEGDILEGEISKKYAVISWNEYSASFCCESEYIAISPTNFEYAKIIGNIYENPELLEKK